jgi:pimeloyl-ACP methyl ester carboxylesterase
MPRARKTASGLETYYEVSGSGSPIVVIPGGLMTIKQMGGLVAAFTKTREVIAIEPQAHGRTADIDRPMTYEDMADDVATLIAELGLGRADVCGFSVGAGIALQAAIRHPGSVRKLAFLSGVFKGDGEYAEIRAFESTFAADSPMLAMNREAYVQAAESAEGWPVPDKGCVVRRGASKVRQSK